MCVALLIGQIQLLIFVTLVAAVPHGKVTRNSDIELVVNMAEIMTFPARSQIIDKGKINNCSGLKDED